jgi:hypothetical protein
MAKRKGVVARRGLEHAWSKCTSLTLQPFTRP